MKRSFARAMVLAVAIGGLVALPLAQAGTARNHAVNSSLISGGVETNNGVTIDAGIIRDRRLGEGAVLIRSRSAGGSNVAINFKVFFPSGLQRGAGTLVATPNQDGTVGLAGNAHYTGGTGRFRGITGRLTVDGTLGTDGLVRATIRGNARY